MTNKLQMSTLGIHIHKLVWTTKSIGRSFRIKYPWTERPSFMSPRFAQNLCEPHHHNPIFSHSLLFHSPLHVKCFSWQPTLCKPTYHSCPTNKIPSQHTIKYHNWFIHLLTLCIQIQNWRPNKHIKLKPTIHCFTPKFLPGFQIRQPRTCLEGHSESQVIVTGLTLSKIIWRYRFRTSSGYSLRE